MQGTLGEGTEQDKLGNFFANKMQSIMDDDSVIKGIESEIKEITDGA